MRLWILSDLHISTAVARTGTMFDDAIPDADVAVIAGDITEGVEEAITWLSRTITRRMPVVYVLGNHEFYGEYLDEARRVAQAQAARVPNLHLLDDSTAMIDGVRFIGATLWTDYRLYSHGERTRQLVAMHNARSRIIDYHQILMEPAQPGFIARNFLPSDALELHKLSCAYIEDQLTVEIDGPTVVVTHHAPHRQSSHPHFDGDPATPAFVSDLSSLIDLGQPTLWVHGHTHHNVDYVLTPLDGPPTRVVANQRGYQGVEIPGFDWRFVVEV
jgi:Icc-related predicted phosphoesterase